MHVLREPPKKPDRVIRNYCSTCPECKAYLAYDTNDIRPNMFNGWIVKIFYITCGYCRKEFQKGAFGLWWDKHRPYLPLKP